MAASAAAKDETRFRQQVADADSLGEFGQLALNRIEPALHYLSEDRVLLELLQPHSTRVLPCTTNARQPLGVATRASVAERLTSIEAELSAWEAVPPGPSNGLSCKAGCP